MATPIGPSHPESPGDRVGTIRWRSDGMPWLALPPARPPRGVTAVAAVRSSVVATRPSYGANGATWPLIGRNERAAPSAAGFGGDRRPLVPLPQEWRGGERGHASSGRDPDRRPRGRAGPAWAWACFGEL